MSNNNTSYFGPSFLGLLAIVFITLKLIGVIQWSWWWVLAPLWIQLVIVLLALVFMLVMAKATGSRVTIKRR